ncbi:hypothetical protein Pmani_021761 [Petrolisthes manimaculis]|uniref:Uncharacterized protein n=1 Tax=Petrolisthes manimaculis TaxID=1843537 RepID=A0AAE1PFK7_9EUCA|nr:hypothetical protein Pmani_021761 [Petrolisthes manimaculis]
MRGELCIRGVCVGLSLFPLHKHPAQPSLSCLVLPSSQASSLTLLVLSLPSLFTSIQPNPPRLVSSFPLYNLPPHPSSSYISLPSSQASSPTLLLRLCLQRDTQNEIPVPNGS